MNIGNRIKQRRIELNLSADELANRIGKSRATIYRYENGDIENMPTTVLEPLAEALHTSAAHLMGWNEDSDIDDSFAYYGFHDHLHAYVQELGEFLYHNPMHKELFDASMDISTEDINLAKQMLNRISGKNIHYNHEDLNAAHARTDIDIPEDIDTSDDDIMNNDKNWK